MVEAKVARTTQNACSQVTVETRSSRMKRFQEITERCARIEGSTSLSFAWLVKSSFLKNMVSTEIFGSTIIEWFKAIRFCFLAAQI